VITIIKESGGRGVAPTAEAVSYIPTGDLIATDVQDAIDELEEKNKIIDGGTAAEAVV